MLCLSLVWSGAQSGFVTTFGLGPRRWELSGGCRVLVYLFGAFVWHLSLIGPAAIIIIKSCNFSCGSRRAVSAVALPIALTDLCAISQAVAMGAPPHIRTSGNEALSATNDTPAQCSRA